jgi:transglutaminase-like putative cysteine protease
MRVYHPNFGGVINVDATPLSDDPDTQVAQVIGMMLDYSDRDAVAPEIRADALRACAMAEGDCVTGNWADVARMITFVQDEDTAEPFSAWLNGPIPETLVRPVDMRRMIKPQGDCDDFSMTIRARMRALGIPCDFATVAVDPDDPERYSHVYAVADCSGGACGPKWNGRVPLDTSHGDYPGWECPNLFGKRTHWPGASGWKIAAGVLVAAGIGAAIWAALR